MASAENAHVGARVTSLAADSRMRRSAATWRLTSSAGAASLLGRGFGRAYLGRLQLDVCDTLLRKTDSRWTLKRHDQFVAFNLRGLNHVNQYKS